jgi:hypothetical protein
VDHSKSVSRIGGAKTMDHSKPVSRIGVENSGSL